MRISNAPVVVLLGLLVVGGAFLAYQLVSQSEEEVTPRPLGPGEDPLQGHLRRLETGTLAGTVQVLSTGEPAAGITVRVEFDEFAFETQTDALGSFSVRAPSDFASTLRVLPSDPFAPVVLPGLRPEPNRTRDLGVVYLGRAFLVRGTVVDHRGRPVFGAMVRAFLPHFDRSPGGIAEAVERVVREEAALESVTAAEDGAFTFRTLSPRRYRFEAAAAGFARGVVPEAVVSPDMAAGTLRIVLTRASSLEGVVRTGSRAPVEAAVVVLLLSRPSGESVRFRSASDAEGRFKFADVPPGQGSLFVSAEGYPVTVVEDVAVGDREPVEVVLGGSCTVEGRVEDRKGDAVPGAEVALIAGTKSEALARGVTDGGGYYRLSNLPPGPIEQLAVRKAGYAPYPRDTDADHGRLEPGETMTLNAILARGSTVRGRVRVAGTDEAAAGVEVRLFDPKESGLLAAGSVSVTDGEGRFRFDGVGAGLHLLLARGGGYHPAWLTEDLIRGVLWPSGDPDRISARAPAVTVGADGGEVVKDLEVHPAARLSGLVRSPDGTPVSGARVSLLPAGSATDLLGDFLGLGDREVLTSEQGEFRITDVPGETGLRLRAAAGGYVGTESEPITTGHGEETGGIEIRLRAGGALTGLVHGADGQPLAGARVRIAEGSREDPWRLQRAAPHVTDETGCFRAEGFLPGPVVIAVDAPDHRRLVRRGLEIREAETTDAGTLRLEEGLAIRGRVQDRNGSPLAGVRVRVEGSRGGEFYREPAFTDEDGRFRIGDLGSEALTLLLDREGFSSAAVRDVEPGGDPVVATLEEERTIEGAVFHPDGTPARRVLVEASQGTAQGQSAWTDDRGEFTIGKLTLGVHTLRAFPRVTRTGAPRSDGPVGLETEMEEISAGTTGVVIRLEPGTEITGRVVDERGEPLSGARVTARPLGGAQSRPGGSDFTSRLGWFTVRGLDGGAYRLTATAEGYVQDAAVEVRGGETSATVTLRRRE